MRIGARQVAVVAVLVLLATGCGKDGTSAAASEIVIGASIPLSGPLAGFGSFQRWGYQHAVDQVNQAGGLQVGGSKRHVRLILLDDKTDPNSTSSNTDTLISRDKATALLGSCTPSLVVAGAVVADRNRVPMVTGCAPLQAFKSVKQWQYVWDVFFDEPDLAEAPFKTLRSAGSCGRSWPRSTATRWCRSSRSRWTTRSSTRSSPMPRRPAPTCS